MMYRVKIVNKGPWPQNLIKLGLPQPSDFYTPGYYAGNKPWQKSLKEDAEELTHKRARLVAGHMKRLGFSATVEPIKEEEYD